MGVPPVLACSFPTSPPPQAEVPHAHDATITAVAWAPAGNVLVSGSHDSTAKVWGRSRPGDTAEQYAYHGNPIRGYPRDNANVVPVPGSAAASAAAAAAAASGTYGSGLVARSFEEQEADRAEVVTGVVAIGVGSEFSARAAALAGSGGRHDAARATQPFNPDFVPKTVPGESYRCKLCGLPGRECGEGDGPLWCFHACVVFPLQTGFRAAPTCRSEPLRLQQLRCRGMRPAVALRLQTTSATDVARLATGLSLVRTLQLLLTLEEGHLLAAVLPGEDPRVQHHRCMGRTAAGPGLEAGRLIVRSTLAPVLATLQRAEAMADRCHTTGLLLDRAGRCRCLALLVLRAQEGLQVLAMVTPLEGMAFMHLRRLVRLASILPVVLVSADHHQRRLQVLASLPVSEDLKGFEGS